jgi:hypothetical protein
LEKSGINFHEFGLGHDFLNMTSEEKATKERICWTKWKLQKQLL